MKEFNPFEQMTFSKDKCFLCGTCLTNENRTKEHVYPQWLQKQFDLWDKSLVLLNSTKIKYKNLTIPCCKECNNIMSTTIENPMKKAVSGGFDVISVFDKDIIFQWLNKLAYGILYKEISLKSARNNPNSEMIYSVDDLKQRKTQYLFLKAAVSNTRFHSKPYSIFIFKVKINSSKKYWAWDNPFMHTFCMQLNDIGIISCLMDNGFNEKFYMSFEKQRELLQHTLHPVQFLEMCSKIVYKASLFYRDPFYTTMFDENGLLKEIVSHDINGNAYSSWDQQEYARLFEFLLKENNYSLGNGRIYQGGDLVSTSLYNEDGSFCDIDI